MTGDNRWDYLVVDPDQGALFHWQNRCANDSPSSTDQDQPNDQDQLDDSDQVDDQDTPESGATRLMDDYFSSLLLFCFMAAFVAPPLLDLHLSA